MSIVFNCIQLYSIVSVVPCLNSVILWRSRRILLMSMLMSGMSGMSVSDRARMKRAMPSTLFVTFAMKERSMNWMVRASESSESSELDTTMRQHDSTTAGQHDSTVRSEGWPGLHCRCASRHQLGRQGGGRMGAWMMWGYPPESDLCERF